MQLMSDFFFFYIISQYNGVLSLFTDNQHAWPQDLKLAFEAKSLQKV